MTVALLGVPWDASSSYRRGPARAPAVIRAEWDRARAYGNPYSELGVDLSLPGRLEDAGDLDPGSDVAGVRGAITARAATLLHAGRRLLTLGGDHSITYPLLSAVRAAVGPVDVLHMDAHADLYPEFEGDRYSHACPFARALEDGHIGRLVQVGIRTLTPAQRAMATRFGVEQVEMKDWEGPFACRFERPVYISVDLDGLDPAHAPGVSHPEPGGLTVRDVIGMLHRLEGRVVAADLVELNPEVDVSGQTAIVAVKLLKELAATLVTS